MKVREEEDELTETKNDYLNELISEANMTTINYTENKNIEIPLEIK